MRIVLVTNPDDDVDFRSAAETCLTRGLDTPAALAACLGDRYPKVRVNGGINEGEVQRWYAYREGLWVSNRVSRADPAKRQR